jgi:hypothetical protein
MNNYYYSVNQFNKDINLQRQNEMQSGGNFNGRLFFKPGEQFQQYEMFSGQQKIENNQVANDRLITNTLNSNPLSQAYFSPNNVAVIQSGIINKVKQISNGQYSIGKQNEQQLLIIMRSMYLQFGKNRENNIQSQINELNTMVVEECARIVIPNIQQQQGYIDDITSGIKIMPWAQNVSGKTTQLEGPASLIPNPETA